MNVDEIKRRMQQMRLFADNIYNGVRHSPELSVEGCAVQDAYLIRDEIDALLPHIEALAKDADRYRWIAEKPPERAALEWTDTKDEIDDWIDEQIAKNNASR